METIWNMGIAWNLSLQNLGSWLRAPMEIFSFLGQEYFFLFLLPTIYWCIEAGVGLRVGIILLLSTSTNDALKMAFHGPRPYWLSTEVIRYASETSFGVPSGHAQTAIGVWGMLAAMIRKWWGWFIAILIVLLIGISRLYLGVHFPHDIILGWFFGAILLWLVLHFWKPFTAWAKRMNMGQQFLAAFLASVVLILVGLIPFVWLRSVNWQPPSAWGLFADQAIVLEGNITTAGTLFGLLAGLAWIDHRGGFSTAGPIWKRVIRLIVGLAGVLVFYVGVDILFGLIAPDTEAVLPYTLRFIRYALVGAWVSAGAPWSFLKLKLAGKGI